MGIAKQHTARRPRQSPTLRPASPYIALGAGALLLALIAKFLYGRSGPLPALALIAACGAFFALAAPSLGRQRAALALLAATVVTNRYTVNIGGLNLKAEHIAIGIALAAVGWGWLRRDEKLRFDTADLLLISWLGLNGVAGLLNAPSSLGSVKLAIMAALVVGAYIAVTRLATDRATFVFGTYALLLAGTGAALFGVIAHLVYPFGIDLGIQINPVTKQPTVYGSFWEGNLFGSFCAVVTIFWIALRLSLRSPLQQRLAEAGILIGLLGLQVSLARGGWLAFLVGLGATVFVALVLHFRHRGLLALQPSRWAAFLPLVVVASMLLWLNPLVFAADYGPGIARSIAAASGSGNTQAGNAAPQPTPGSGNTQAGNAAPQPTPAPAATPVRRPSSGSAVERAASAANTSDATYVQRSGDIVRALRDWRAHPIIGWGPGSYGQKYITTSYTPAWLPTFSIRFLHDSGIIGLLLSHAALALIALRGVQALWRSTDPLLQALLFGYVVAGIVLALAYEITDGFQLAFAWLFLGLLVAGAQVVERSGKAVRPAVALRLGRLGTLEFERPQVGRPDGAALAAAGRTALASSAAWSRQARANLPARLAAVRTAALTGLRAHWALLLAAVVGLITTFYNLGFRGLWGDEVWTAWWSFPRLFLIARSPTDFPMHWILVTIATMLGKSAFWVRLPSAALGTITVVALFLVGRRLLGTRTALSAALLLAISPTLVWNAQEARPHIGLACYSILLLYFSLQMLDSPTRSAWLGFTLAATLNLLNQFFALLPLASVIAVATVIVGTRWYKTRNSSLDAHREIRTAGLRTLSGMAGGVVIAVVLASPFLLGAIAYLLSESGGSGKTATVTSPVTLPYLQVLFGTFGAGHGWPFQVLAVLCALGVIHAIIRRQGLPLLIAAIWLIGPLLALLVLKTNHTFDTKYLLFMMPIYILLIGHGVSGIIDAIGAVAERLFGKHGKNRGPSAARVFCSLALAAALTFVMVPSTWASYRVEKLNDWTAVCDYLRSRVEAGDRITGDGYYEGIMLWCFSGSSSVSLASANGKTPAQIAETGQNVWYVRLNQTPEAALTGANYEAIPRAEWARPGVGPQTRAESRRLTFSQGEHPVSLYYHRAPEVPSMRTFAEVKGSGTWPDYAQIGPGGDYLVPLGLAPAAPRIVRINYFDLQGRDLDVYANGVLLEKIKVGASGGSWIDRDLPLPAEVGARFTLRLHNPGKEISAFSKVEVRYADGR